MCNKCFHDNKISTTAMFSVDKGDYTISIGNVPCLKCPNCGEVTFTDEVSAKLEKMVEEMALKRSKPRRPLTDEQIAEIESRAPKDEDIAYDEDCPPTTPEQAANFRRARKIWRDFNADGK